MSRIIPLTPQHAAEVESLARRIYPEGYHLSEEDIAENLEGVEEDGTNFCLAVLDDDRMVGYLMAWLDNTLLEGKVEDVVLVDDLALLPNARPHLIALLRGLMRAMEEAGCIGFPIEGTVRKALEDTFTAHTEVFESLGYQLVGSHEYTDDSLEEVLVWIRFEPTEPASRRLDDDEEDEVYEETDEY